MLDVPDAGMLRIDVPSMRHMIEMQDRPPRATGYTNYVWSVVISVLSAVMISVESSPAGTDDSSLGVFVCKMSCRHNNWR